MSRMVPKLSSAKRESRMTHGTGGRRRSESRHFFSHHQQHSLHVFSVKNPQM